MSYGLDMTPREYLEARGWQVDQESVQAAGEVLLAPYEHPVYETWHTLEDAYLTALTEDIERLGGLRELMSLADAAGHAVEY